jgi:hypothetical protein
MGSDNHFVSLSWDHFYNDHGRDFEDIIRRRSGSLYWLTCFLNLLLWRLLVHGALLFPICIQSQWLLMLLILLQCSYVGLLWWDELREEHLPRGSLGSSLCSFAFCSYSFAWLQPRYGDRWGFSPSSMVQLQQLGVDSLSFVSAPQKKRAWSPIPKIR